jgi:transcriptional regulator with XRE-family HTH domain
MDSGVSMMDTLRILREAKDLKQHQVAEMLGVDRSTYTRWETGDREPDNSSLVRIADLFQVTTDYLLERPFAFVSYSPGNTETDPTENMRIAMELALNRPVDRAHAETLLVAYDRLTRSK